MGLRFGSLAGQVLDEENPINWDHPLAAPAGMAAMWMPIQGASFYGGNQLRDLSFCRNVRKNGALTNGPMWATRSLYFDGSGGYVNCLAPSSLCPTNKITVAATFKAITGLGSATWQQIIGRGSAFQTWAYMLLYNSTTLRFYASNNGGGFASYAAGKDVWLTAVATYDGANTRLYVGTQNDFVTGTAGTQTGTMTNAAKFGIGRGHRVGTDTWAEPDVFGGYVSQVNVWNERVLTAAEANSYVLEANTGFPNLMNWLSTRTWFGTTGAAPSFNAGWASGSNRVLLGGVV